MRFFVTDYELDSYVREQKAKDVEWNNHTAQRKLWDIQRELRGIIDIAKMAEHLILYKNWPASKAVDEAKEFHDTICELTPKENQ